MPLPTLRTSSRILAGTVLGLATTITIRDLFLELHHVTGSSMSPSLSPDHHATGRRDHLLVYKQSASIHRGDVVSLWNPCKPEEQAVKRVIGTEGDILETRARYPWRVIKVPHGHVWVEGDNAGNSRDSNDYGPVPMGLVTGKAVCIVWPWGRIGRVPDARRRKEEHRITPGVSEVPPEYRDD